MRIIGCDLQTRQQTLAMLDTETGRWSDGEGKGVDGLKKQHAGRARVHLVSKHQQQVPIM